MKIGILVAMDREYSSLAAAGLHCRGIRLTLNKTGIGKVNSAIAATRMILENKPDCIINTGLAGGMLDSMKVADLAVATRSAYHDVWCGEGNAPGQVQGLPVFFEADPKLLAAARKIGGNCGHTMHCGLICSGDQFFISTKEDDRIRAMFPGVMASDMESTAIAQVCYKFGVPFLNFRIISDIHKSNKIQKESYEAFKDTFSHIQYGFLNQLLQLI